MVRSLARKIFQRIVFMTSPIDMLDYSSVKTSAEKENCTKLIEDKLPENDEKATRSVAQIFDFVQNRQQHNYGLNSTIEYVLNALFDDKR
jgi:hypothetical protein